jgi:hypothetical protein
LKFLSTTEIAISNYAREINTKTQKNS